MGGVLKKIIALGLLIGVTYGVLSYHFILLDNGVKILRKTKLHYANTFVDGRGIKEMKLFLEPDLLEAGIRDAIR